MKIANETLFLTTDDLIGAGFSSRTLESWTEPVKVADPADSRKKLYRFEALAAKYKDQVIAKYGDPYEACAEEQIKQLLERDEQARKYYQRFKFEDGTGLPEEHIANNSVAADWMNLIDRCINKMPKLILKALNLSKKQFWEVVCQIIEKEKIWLPASYVKLTRKLNEYLEKGYNCLLRIGKFGNSNSAKITGESADWLVAMYALPIKMQIPELHLKYMLECTRRRDVTVSVAEPWEPLTQQGIYNYLYRPDVIQAWYYGRHGEKEYTKKFGIQHKNALPVHRDALWFSDGTGLNFESKDQKMHRLYWVMDAYSECILGYSVAPSEQHQVVFQAAKNAMNFAGAKPYEWRYDHGSAHEKLNNFFDRAVSKLHFMCAPYSGSSKTIESMTKRFQKSCMQQYWFFTGMNRGSRTLDSKQNEDFVDKHAKELPLFEDVLIVLKTLIEDWNNGAHFATGIAHREMYLNSTNPKHCEFGTMDAVELFWTSTEATYRQRGIAVNIGKSEYEFEVQLDEMPDTTFRSKWIGQKFVVKYDPADMSYVVLYVRTETGLQLITTADAKREDHLATIDHQPGELGKIRATQALKRSEIKRAALNLVDLEQRTGISGNSLVIQQNEKVKRLSQASKFREDDMNGHGSASLTTVGSIYGDEEASYRDVE